MNKWKIEISKHIYSVSYPLFYFSRLWGVAPFCIYPSGSGYILELSVKYVIYSFVLGSSLFFFSMHNLVKLIHGEVTKYAISIETTITVQLNVLIGIFGLIFRLPSIITYLNCIKQIDLVIPMVNPASVRRALICKLIIILGIQTIFMIFDLYVGGISGLSTNDRSMSYNFLAHYLSYYIILTIVFQYAHIVNAIGRRINGLHTVLSSGLNRDVAQQSFNVSRTVVDSKVIEWISDKKGTTHKEDRFSRKYLEDMIKVYLNICDTANAVNDCYGFTILVIIFTCLIQLTVHLYFILSSVVNQTDVARMTVECLWLLLHFCRLLMVVEPCNKCLIKVKALKALIGKLQCVEFGSQYEEQLSLFCAHLFQHPIEFSAFGLGSIDRSLITSFAGAVATYLVIILQFEAPG